LPDFSVKTVKIRVGNQKMQASKFSGSLCFTAVNTENLSVPLLVSVPHAGRDYPDELFANLRLPPNELLRLEDRYADLLVREISNAGIPTIVAQRARAWIDLNRDETDIDADMVDGADRDSLPAPGAKQRGGLGLIPRRLSGSGDIWRGRFAIADIASRIEQFHRPYHKQIAETLAQIRAKFGIAILLDVHSMPPLHLHMSGTQPQIVIGDLFGRSAQSRFSESLLARIKQYGLGATLNHPYSGDYILRRQSKPAHNIHALQLEVDRQLYLDDILREPGPGLASTAGLVSELAQILIDEAQGSQTLMAAE
jgi:N-formylglutamate amidohydrolase